MARGAAARKRFVLTGIGPRTFWLVSDTEGGVPAILSPGSEKALPIFSFEEEADMFIGFPRDGRRATLITEDELLGVLLGPCADVGWVLLDPLPDLAGAEAVGMRRETLVERLLDRWARREITDESLAGTTRGSIER